MNTELENPSEQLDPLVVGVFASAPLTDATRRVLLEQQTACAAVETAEKMAERARLIFMTLENGPHPAGMLPCRLHATNGLLELVSKAAHTIWTSHRSEIRVMCPELWDEELVRGWLLMDSMEQWLATGAAVRTVGKRAAAQVWSASGRAKTEAKRARTNAPRPEDRDAAAEAARKEVWAEACESLMANVPAKEMVTRPRRPFGAAAAAAKPAAAVITAIAPAALAAAVASTATTSTTAATTPTTCPQVGESARPPTADLTQEDCRLLRFEASELQSTQLAKQVRLVVALEAHVKALKEQVEQMRGERAFDRRMAEMDRAEKERNHNELRCLHEERKEEWARTKEEWARTEEERAKAKKRYEELRATLRECERQVNARDDALKFAEWTIEGGHRPLTAWLPNRWYAEELTREEAADDLPGSVPGTVFYQNLATDEATWDHPRPQLWDDVWEVVYGTGDRPPAYEKYCRRYEDDHDEP